MTRRVEPERDTLFTSVSDVRALLVSENGDLWVGTTGGVLHCANESDEWTLHNRQGDTASRLPSHETISLQKRANGNVVARFANGTSAEWHRDIEQNRWQRVHFAAKSKKFPILPPMEAVILWSGKTVRLSDDGTLKIGDTAPIGLPPNSIGTHISAFTVWNDALLVTVWHDPKLYTLLPATDFRTFRWQVANKIALPPPLAGQITALSGRDDELLLATRRAGLWSWNARENQLRNIQPVADAPPAHNAQTLQTFRGALYVGTLEDGLVVRDTDGWRQLRDDVLSSNAPRQMVVFDNRLYLRHGNGVVDSFDGAVWRKNVLQKWLPRKQVSTFSVGANGTKLFVAQWGGWSVFGKNLSSPRHFLREPKLQGTPITALIADDGKANAQTLFVGTQGKGFFEASAQTGVLRAHHDERSGLTDDWITALSLHKGTLYAGTFVGGLLRSNAPTGRERLRTWHSVAGFETENITDFAVAGGVLFAATRHGVRAVRDSASKPRTLPALVSANDVEAQALCAMPTGGLWMGTRTGIFYIAPKITPGIGTIAPKKEPNNAGQNRQN